MTKRLYIVQPCDGFVGVEFLADPPVGRRVYQPGEEVELDDKIHDIQNMLRTGIVAPAPAAPRAGSAKVVPGSTDKIVSRPDAANDSTQEV